MRAKPIKYIVARQFRKVEVASGMMGGEAGVPTKETVMEMFSTYSSKKEAEKDYKSEVEKNELRRFFCEVKHQNTEHVK